MIEKLDTIKHTDNLYDRNGFITNVACGGVVISKINELVDAVNELQLAKDVMFNRIDMLNNAICDMRNATENSQSSKIAQGFKNLQDPYAEQRKWVGKLCWFWDEEEADKVFGILTTIDSDCGLSDMCPYWNDTTSNWFEHCEPVKPDDDIIYKGGDNE